MCSEAESLGEKRSKYQEITQGDSSLESCLGVSWMRSVAISQTVIKICASVNANAGSSG